MCGHAAWMTSLFFRAYRKLPSLKKEPWLTLRLPCQMSESQSTFVYCGAGRQYSSSMVRNWWSSLFVLRTDAT